MTKASKITQPTSQTSLGSQPWSSATSAFLWTFTLKSVTTESSENVCAQYVSVLSPLRCHSLPRLHYGGLIISKDHHNILLTDKTPHQSIDPLKSIPQCTKLYTILIIPTSNVLIIPVQYILHQKQETTVSTCVLGTNHIRSGHSEVNNRSTR